MRLLIVGAPGSGKGTQAARLAADLGIPAISTGDLFRAHVRESTPLGIRVSSILAGGGYVPDELTNELVAERLAEPDARGGFLLDGYPRTIAQVIELDRMLRDQGTRLDAVVHLVVDRDTLVSRLGKRASEQGRADDDPAAIAHRLALYDTATTPVLRVYAQRSLVVTIDGVGALGDVAERIHRGLADLVDAGAA